MHALSVCPPAGARFVLAIESHEPPHALSQIFLFLWI
jgi:hypothetical protein